MRDIKTGRLSPGACGVFAAAVLVAALSAVALAAPRDGAIPGPLAERIGPLLRDGSPALQATRLAGASAPDSLFAVVIMCDFADSLLMGRNDEMPDSFPISTQTDFWYDAHDSLFFEHKFQDVRAYFDAASRGRFHLAYTVHPEAVNLPHPMAWYGDHPEYEERPVELAADVVAAVDADIDFSAYDTVILVHAGAGQETDLLRDSPEQLYSTYVSPEDLAAAVEEERLDAPWIATDDLDAFGDPVVLDQFLILPETERQDNAAGAGTFGTLGVYCFEIGLRLGMLSLSDFTPSGNPDSQGIGEFGLMGYGLFVAGGLIPDHPCAFNRMLMGWVDPYDVSPDAAGTFTLNPAWDAESDSTVARVEISPSEYWLLEYRLQDPDGNNRFSFPGDVNRDGIPNFFAIDDSTFQPYFLSDVFDPALHVKETLAGGEWDFYMSDNGARPKDEFGYVIHKAAGSGLYVWHVDEGVLREAFAADLNLFNADAARKSVDVEEADGIQDLDNRRGGYWILGGDEDSFRAEDNAVFGPWTNPSTTSAGGAPTGIVIDGISAVVTDSTFVNEAEETVIRYAQSMRFSVRREATAGAPVRVATRRLPGRDLRGSHLVAADIEPDDDGSIELVLAADHGAVLAFEPDLSDMLEGMAQPGLLAQGRDTAGVPVSWVGAPAVAAVADNGRFQIILTADTGLYLFNGDDGTEVVDGDGEPLSSGLALPLAGCDQPPVVDADGVVYVVERLEDGVALRRWPAGSLEPLPVPSVRVLAPPVLVDGRPAVACEHLVTGDWLFQVAGDAGTTALDERPSGLRPLVEARTILIPTVDGGAIALDNAPGYAVLDWQSQVSLETPPSAGFAFAGDDRFTVTGSSGSPRTGWPQAPRPGVRTAEARTAPGALSFSRGGRQQTLFTARDGRHYLYDDTGRLQPGWPLAGPGETAGTPVLLDLVDGLQLVAAGTFERIIGLDEDGLEGEVVSELTAWSLPGTAGAETVWPMWGGGPSRGVVATAQSVTSDVAGLLDPDGVHCYPQPLAGSTLHVRALVLRPCRLTATLYNFEGEVVRADASVEARAGEPAEVLFEVDGIASGVYLCRLTATDGSRTEIRVLPVAVSR